MSSALAVHHGLFGRAAVYVLDRGMAMHAHREGHLIFHVQGPPGAIRIDEETYPLDGRGGVAISPWQPHNYIALGEPAPSVFLVLYIKPAWFLGASRQPNAALRFGRKRIDMAEPIGRLAARAAAALLDEAEEDEIGGALYALTQASFDQSWQWIEDGPPLACACACGQARDFRLRNAARLMRSRLCDHVPLDEIARESGLSRPHFYKLFRQQIGITPNIYLNTLRMETAIDRLTQGQDAVTEIGLDLGFSSQASFTRFFIANVGVAPSDYRRVALVAGAA